MCSIDKPYTTSSTFAATYIYECSMVYLGRLLIGQCLGINWTPIFQTHYTLQFTQLLVWTKMLKLNDCIRNTTAECNPKQNLV